jgi:hypothetical protein
MKLIDLLAEYVFQLYRAAMLIVIRIHICAASAKIILVGLQITELNAVR